MTYTELEQKVFNQIVSNHDHEIDYGPTFNELLDVLNIEKNVLKGVLGSLAKKKSITIDEEFGVPDCYTANL